jgi:DNA-binding beta-propeller fold protein YncE
MRYLICWLLLLSLLLTAFAGGNVNVGRYTAVPAVPAPAGGVVIDGNLSDWDRSGEFYTYRYEEQKDVFNYRGYMMYDAQNLYISQVVTDSTPMVNNNSPETDAVSAWRGDCLQARFCLDPKLGWQVRIPYQGEEMKNDRIVHLTMWYYTARQQPCLQIQYGMNYHNTKVNPIGYKAVYKKGADGRSYTMEWAISWSLLNAGDNPPKAGDTMACTWQALWGDELGRTDKADLSDIRNPDSSGFVYQDAGSWGKLTLEKTGNLPPGTVKAKEAPLRADTGFIPLNYTIPGKGKKRVSMQVEDAKGHTVRWLLGNAERNTGRNKEMWNGLDNDGKPVPAGEYRIRWCYSGGIGVKLAVTVDNPGNPPYNSNDGTGSWAGDYGVPVAVCSNGTNMFLAHECGEASKTIIGLTPSGQKIWGNAGSLDISMTIRAMATDGTDVYVLSGGGWYMPEWRPNTKAGIYKLDCQNGYLSPIGDTGSSSMLMCDPDKTGRGSKDDEYAGIAVNADTIFISAPKSGLIYCIEKKSGKQLRIIDKFDGPRGLAWDKTTNKLYVATAWEVIRMNSDGSARQTIVNSNWWMTQAILPSPNQLAIAPNGDIFLGLRGTENRVIRFDSKGKLLNGIGKRGGLVTPGPWDKDAMRNPQGLAISPDGNLWVTEGVIDPRRTSVWTVDGKFVRDFIGPAPYSPQSVMDADDPDHLYVDSAKFSLNYATGRGEVAGVTGECGGRVIVHVAGRAFITGSGSFAHIQGITEMVNDRFVPLVTFGKRNCRKDYNWGTCYATLNVDRNRNGIIEPGEEEVMPTNWGGLWPPRLLAVAPNLDLYIGSGTYQYLLRVPFEGFDAAGAPRYTFAHQQMIFVGQQERLKDYPGAKLYPFGTPYGAVIEDVTVDNAGSIYMLINNGDKVIKRGETVLDKGHRLVKFTANGDILWEYRNIVVSHPASRNTTISKSGEIHGAIKFTGFFGKYITVGSYYNQYHVLDAATGLYITSLTPDLRADVGMNEFTVYTENFNGQAVYVPKTKKYLYCGGDAGIRVWEVSGLNDVRFDDFKIKMSPSEAEQAQSAAKVEKGLPATAKKTMETAPLAITIDGKLDEWKDAEWAAFRYDDKRQGRAAVAWRNSEPNVINIAFDITDDSPMRNAGGNPNLLFKTGDCLEVGISSAAVDAERKDDSPVTGDKRLLIAWVKDAKGVETPLVMLYEPKSDRADKISGTFTSPTGKEVYDHVTPLKKVTAALLRTTTGYAVELRLDATELGLGAMENGRILRTDFGTLFSDQGGVSVLTRAMWADDSNELGVNNDVPTESRIHPKRWGWLRLP